VKQKSHEKSQSVVHPLRHRQPGNMGGDNRGYPAADGVHGICPTGNATKGIERLPGIGCET